MGLTKPIEVIVTDLDLRDLSAKERDREISDRLEDAGIPISRTWSVFGVKSGSLHKFRALCQTTFIWYPGVTLVYKEQ